MPALPDLIDAFRGQGLKITPQRRAIFQALDEVGDHPTAEEIYRSLIQALPDTSRTTVYNTLRQLVALGQLVEIDLGEGKARYDTNVHPHHHLHCLRCHALVDIYLGQEKLAILPEEPTGFSIVAQRVLFDGHCSRCQSQ